MRVAGVELGGTKTVVVAGSGGKIEQRIQFPTTSPGETLAKVSAALREFDAVIPIEAVGIASFGPIRLDPMAADYGTILATPKPGWTGVDVVGPARIKAQLPIIVDTDVNAAAIAEHRLGAAQGCANVIYLTIGTGLGGGVLVEGIPVHGVLHPEIGHIRTRRAAGDVFPGTCPFHKDCIEGLISGPALAARFGCDPSTIDPDDGRWIQVASDLAELLAALILTHSPQRIVLGGGVSIGQPAIIRHVVKILPNLLAGYLTDFDAERIKDTIVGPKLMEDAGPVGAMLLALR
ncbi:ROK family protein [Allopontixanthobacter sp.]|uniref:ROK family protein n=1 Tax=Allopontixanthobacter sp. TaxID=2906452 RepID=UPI002ABC090A|nr:ROK family protein [Allopontixanthobacter sp.]MDZ4308087.1 ROK family protein [Allopontixanthobacter sp.]